MANKHADSVLKALDDIANAEYKIKKLIKKFENDIHCAINARVNVGVEYILANKKFKKAVNKSKNESST